MEESGRLLASMRPMRTRPTGMAPKLTRLDGIRAVVFDLYGTLLISDAGCSPPRRVSKDFDEAVFEACIRNRQEDRRAQGIEYPEVDIREVWQDYLEQCGNAQSHRGTLETIAFRHECETNPVWPMPRAAATLKRLRNLGLPLGIISNAQFYTVPVMEALFRVSLDELGFHPDLRIFSFEEREGKPSVRLFEKLAAKASSLGIDPASILYLGNDYHKDVLPARSVGFKTGLFAGDARSLRLGGTSETQARETSDLVITRLDQIVGCLG